MIVISDTHCSCQLGLIRPEGIDLDEGGHYTPNVIQLQMWAWWREFWDQWVPAATRGGPYDILLNGDWIDNEHHGVKTLITNNIQVQRQIGLDCLRPQVERAQALGGRFYVVRGTAAHDGGSGQDVEMMARELGAVPNEFGRCSRWELWKRIEGPDPHCLVHALHHIGSTSRTAYETSAPKAEITEEMVSAAKTGQEAPRFTVRSHRHRPTEAPEFCVWGRAWALVPPGWQAKTELAYRVAGARTTQPIFGGLLLRNGEEEVYPRFRTWELARPRIER